MVRSAKDWKWSSYHTSVAQSKKPDWLKVDWLLSQFAKTKGVAIKRYKDYVKGGKNQSSPMEALKNQIYLGSNKFVESMLSKLEQQVDPSETPKKQRTLAVLTLEDIKQISGSRNEGIVQSYFKGHFTLKQIGDFYELHYSRVSRIVSQEKAKHL